MLDISTDYWHDSIYNACHLTIERHEIDNFKKPPTLSLAEKQPTIIIVNS